MRRATTPTKPLLQNSNQQKRQRRPIQSTGAENRQQCSKYLPGIRAGCLQFSRSRLYLLFLIPVVVYFFDCMYVTGVPGACANPLNRCQCFPIHCCKSSGDHAMQCFITCTGYWIYENIWIVMEMVNILLPVCVTHTCLWSTFEFLYMVIYSWVATRQSRYPQ